MSNSNDAYWWKEKSDKLYDSVFSYVRNIQNDQSYRQMENLKYMKLYGNYDFTNLQFYNYQRAEPSGSIQNRVTLNIIQNMIDTVVSKISKNKPKPTFLTEAGDFTQQRKAKKLTQFVEGQFQITDFYSESAFAFLDSCIFGTGAIKIYRDGDKIKAERIFPDELVVDDRESFYGKPRQMHQKKYIHKDVLKEMFPDARYKIDELAHGNMPIYASGQSKASDLILVVESWHLPSSDTAKDGRHSLCIENCTLFEEKYTKNYFPFVFWRWSLRQVGFFGQGLAEQLMGLQLEINKILRTIQVSMHLVSIPKIFVEASSKIVDAHIDNKIGGIIKYAGQPPTPSILGSIPPELFSHLDRLYGRAYEIAGVSQLSATSQKPAGLNSGKALREYNDIETERFMAVGQRYEKVFLDAARQMIDLAKEIDADLAEEGGYKVKVKGKNFLKTIKWKEVDIEDDQYVMGLFPTSALSSTPAGRLQDVQEYIQAGFIDRDQAMKLLDFPDLEGYFKFNNAGLLDIDRLVEKFIDEGEYETPEPYQNLNAGIVKMQQAYLVYRADGAPEERLELFRRWIEDANTLIKKASMEVQKEQMQMQQEADMAAQTAAINAQAPAAEPIPVDSQIPEDVTQPQ